MTDETEDGGAVTKDAIDRGLLEILEGASETTRVLVAVIEVAVAGDQPIMQMLIRTGGDFSPVTDAVAIVDQMLHRLTVMLEERTDDEWARGRLAQVKAARAALDFAEILPDDPRPEKMH